MTRLNVRYMLTGTPVRMRYTYRWATSRVSFPENVAEHSWFVCFYSLMIARWVCEHSVLSMAVQTDDGFIGSVLKRAVLHDIEEARSGDIHRPFKYSHETLTLAMKRASAAAAEQTLQPLMWTQDGRDDLLTCWETSKDETYEGRIVRFADMLSVLAFVIQEGKDAVSGLSLETIRPHFEEFESSKYEFIRPIVSDSRVILEEILNG